MPAIAAALLAASLALSPDRPAADRPTPPPDGAWRTLAAIARGEPPVSEIQAAAARHADGPAGSGPALARQRAAALLPRVTAELRVDDRSYRVVGLQGSGEVDYARQAPGWLAAVRATWDLGALASPGAERTSARWAIDRARRRDDAVRKATAAYFERRRLRLALELSPPEEPAARAQALLELERLAAELDALTGGAFTGRRW